MPVFGDYETVGGPYATRVDHGHSFTIWQARRIGASEGRLYAVKCYTSPNRGPGENSPENDGQANRELERLESFKQLQKAQAEGGTCLAPIHKFGQAKEGVWYSTDFYPLTLNAWIAGGGQADGAGLRQVIYKLALGCLELKRASGRSHGNLKPSNIFLAGKPRNLGPNPVLLIDIQPVQLAYLEDHSLGGLVFEVMEVQDLRSIGELILQLVEGRVMSQAIDRPQAAVHPEAFEKLGKDAEQWRRLCSTLLDPQMSLDKVNLAWLEQELRPGGPEQRLEEAGGIAAQAVETEPRPDMRKRRSPVLVAAVVAIGLLLAAIYFFFLKQPPSTQQPPVARVGRPASNAVAVVASPAIRPPPLNQPDPKIAELQNEKTNLTKQVGELLSRLEKEQQAAADNARLREQLREAESRRDGQTQLLQQSTNSLVQLRAALRQSTNQLQELITLTNALALTSDKWRQAFQQASEANQKLSEEIKKTETAPRTGSASAEITFIKDIGFRMDTLMPPQKQAVSISLQGMNESDPRLQLFPGNGYKLAFDLVVQGMSLDIAKLYACYYEAKLLDLPSQGVDDKGKPAGYTTNFVFRSQVFVLSKTCPQAKDTFTYNSAVLSKEALRDLFAKSEFRQAAVTGTLYQIIPESNFTSWKTNQVGWTSNSFQIFSRGYK